MKILRRNEAFDCAFCGEENPKAPKTCRNHCRACLYSLHVDAELPGDRGEECRGRMSPFHVEQHAKKGWMILHKCEKCGAIKRNKAAEDDSYEKILEIARKSTEKFIKNHHRI